MDLQEEIAKRLQESIVSDQYKLLDEPETIDIEGIVDGVLVVTDPEITSDEYEEIINRAEEVVEDTPEGELPFSEDYIGNYVQMCPICGQSFITPAIKEVGDACPVCLDTPQAFVLLGKLNSTDDESEKRGFDDVEDTDETEAVPNAAEANLEDEDDQGTQLDLASKQIGNGNKLAENKKLKTEVYNEDGFPNSEELVKFFTELNDLPDEITIDNENYFMEQYGGNGANSWCIYTSKENEDSYIKVFYTLKQVGENSYKGVNEITGVSDLRESKQLKTEDEKLSDITWILDDYDTSITTSEELGSDYFYRTLCKTVNDAERFNYHSDYWGDANTYQEENIDLMEQVEPYVGKEVTVDTDDGTLKVKVLGIVIDKQYNSIGHTLILVENVEALNESVDSYNRLKVGSKFSDGNYEIEVLNVELQNHKNNLGITVTCRIKNDKEDRVTTFSGDNFLQFLNLKDTTLLKEQNNIKTEKMNGFKSENSRAEQLFDELQAVETFDKNAWNDASNAERETMLRPIIIKFYKENRSKIDDNWDDFMELLEYWNYHTEYKIFDELSNDNILRVNENKQSLQESVRPNEDRLVEYFEMLGLMDGQQGKIIQNLLSWLSDDDIKRWAQSNDYTIFNESKLNELKEISVSENYSAFAWDDEDVEYIKTLLDNVVTPVLDDRQRYGNVIDLKLTKTEYIESGIINFTDKFYNTVQEYVNSKYNGAELSTNNTGSVIWVKSKVNESKLVETGEWDDDDDEMSAWLDDMRIMANELAVNVHGSVESVTGFDKYQGPRAIVRTPIHGDIELWYDGEDDTGRSFVAKVAHFGWISGDINKLSDLLNKDIIPDNERIDESKHKGEVVDLNQVKADEENKILESTKETEITIDKPISTYIEITDDREEWDYPVEDIDEARANNEYLVIDTTEPRVYEVSEEEFNTIKNKLNECALTETVAIEEMEDLRQRLDYAEDVDDIQDIIFSISDGVLENEVQLAFDQSIKDGDEFEVLKDYVITALEDNAEYED